MNRNERIKKAVEAEKKRRKENLKASKEISETLEKHNDNIMKKITPLLLEITDQKGLSEQKARQRLTKKEKAQLKRYIFSRRGDYSDKAIQKDYNKIKSLLERRKTLSRLDELEIIIDIELLEGYDQYAEKAGTFLAEQYEESINKAAHGKKMAQPLIAENASALLGTAWALDDKTIRDRLIEKLYKNARTLKNELKQSIILGKHPSDCIKDLKAVLPRSATKDIEMLIQTESTYINNRGVVDALKFAGIKEFEIVATLDSKTSEICRSMDGKVFPVKDAQTGVNVPPFHPRCRTIVVGYFKGETDERAYRDEKGKTKFTTAKSYRQWQREMSDKE